VPVHDVGTLADGRPFYVMKRVRGERLDVHARGGVPRAELLRAFRQVCDAVAFAHAAGVVHRDLKPQNVMVGRFGEVLVLDWGVAAVAADSSAIEAGAVVGTPGFMAPEQAAGASHVDRRADVFALGGLLHGLLDAPPPRPLAAVVQRAQASRPDDRYDAVEALQADVRRYLDGLAVSAYAEPLAERLRRVVDRYRVPIGLVAAYMIMRLALIAWSS